MSEKNKGKISKGIKEENKNILNNKRKRKNIKSKKKKKENKENENLENIIIGNIYIKEDNLTKRIINSFENVKKEKPYIINGESKENEKEIKSCEIFINDKKINFTYFYKFKKAGNYSIKYKFKNLLNLFYLIERKYNNTEIFLYIFI